MRRAAVVVLAALVLAGCHQPPTSGVVQDRQFTPMFVSFTPCGKVQCPIVHPAVYYLTIQGDTFAVSKAVYDQCLPGAQYHRTNEGEGCT